MSNDLRNIAPEFRQILLNRDAIAVDQDPMGRMGRLVANVSSPPFGMSWLIFIHHGEISTGTAYLKRFVTTRPLLLYINVMTIHK